MQATRGTILTAHDRALAFVSAGTAVGIAVFWANWFLSGAFRHEGSDCYRAFENTFPPSDLVLAGLLVWAALGLWRGAVPRVAGALAVGMLLHLSSLDLLWHGLGIFTVGQNPSAAFIVALTFLLALWLMLRVARAPREVPSLSPMRRAGAAAISAGYVLFTAYYWWNHFLGTRGSPELDPCAQTFTSVFWLADLLGCVFAVWALLATPWWTRSARFAHLAVAGGMFFGTTNVLVFVLLETERVGALWGMYLVVGAVFYAATAGLVACVCPRSAPRATSA